MSVKEKLSHFWNDTLGVDYPDEENIEDSEKPEYKDLKESLSRVEDMEKKYKISSANSSKGGKGSSVVEKEQVDSTKAIKKAEEKASEAKSNEQKTAEDRETR